MKRLTLILLTAVTFGSSSGPKPRQVREGLRMGSHEMTSYETRTLEAEALYIYDKRNYRLLMNDFRYDYNVYVRSRSSARTPLT